MTVSAPTDHDKKEWIHAFRMHQVDTMEARSRFFERKLEREGLRVPRASILVTKGMNAPLLAIQQEAAQQSRTGSIKLEKMQGEIIIVIGIIIHCI